MEAGDDFARGDSATGQGVFSWAARDDSRLLGVVAVRLGQAFSLFVAWRSILAALPYGECVGLAALLEMRDVVRHEAKQPLVHRAAPITALQRRGTWFTRLLSCPAMSR